MKSGALAYLAYFFHQLVTLLGAAGIDKVRNMAEHAPANIRSRM